MRVAALYDIHGNLPALDAVLADVEREQVDAIVVGGDVAAGPLPVATLERLMGLGERAIFVQGNADREILEAHDALTRDPTGGGGPDAEATAVFAAERITPAQREFLAGFAATVEIDVDGLGQVLFCHGSPRTDTEIITPLTSEARLEEILASVEPRVVVGGHTHRQFDRRCAGRRIVNAGSIGLPYEGRAGA